MNAIGEKERIAMRVAREFQDGDVVNLGIGTPTLAADYIPGNIRVTLQSENGILGMGPAADGTNLNKTIINAGGEYVTVRAGACFFDSALSFAIIRGGHLDIAVLGALEVDERGNLASHAIPGKMMAGMGGAMDLVVGARRVLVAMTHTAKGGAPKIMKKLTLPATAIGKVSLIVTEMAVIEVTCEGLALREIAEGLALEQVRDATEATLLIGDNLKIF